MRPDFTFGVASAAPQIEGAADVDGRTPSTWDVFAAVPGNIRDGSTPAVTTDAYHRFDEDLALMREARIDASRFSLWSMAAFGADLAGFGDLATSLRSATLGAAKLDGLLAVWQPRAAER